MLTRIDNLGYALAGEAAEGGFSLGALAAAIGAMFHLVPEIRANSATQAKLVAGGARSFGQVAAFKSRE